MFLLPLLFAAALAFLPDATDSAHAPATPTPSSENAFQRSKVLMFGHNAFTPKHKGDSTRSSLLLVAPAVAVAAMVFLILHCLRVLQSGINSRRNEANKRKLADRSPNACTVCLGVQQQDLDPILAAQQTRRRTCRLMRVPAAFIFNETIFLGCQYI